MIIFITQHTKHLLNSIRYSFLGVKTALCNEMAFQQEAFLFCILCPLGIWLGRTPTEKTLLVGSLLIVLITELLNSAIETVVDRISTDFHHLSGRAKDLGSAAVFFSLLNVVIVWGIIIFSIVFNK